MSFALYGTVPRWEDRRMVTHALAPTAEPRHGAAGVRRRRRPLRRRPGAAPQPAQGGEHQERPPRTARRPGTRSVRSTTRPSVLAADSQVNRRVEKLLGLTVRALLHSASCCRRASSPSSCTPSRATGDDILFDLLGLGMYEEIGQAPTPARKRRPPRERRRCSTEQLGGLRRRDRGGRAGRCRGWPSLTALAGGVDRRCRS